MFDNIHQIQASTIGDKIGKSVVRKTLNNSTYLYVSKKVGSTYTVGTNCLCKTNNHCSSCE
jgi:hypothetical protein